MPTYSVIKEEELCNKIDALQLAFQQEAIFVNGEQTRKPIIITAGVATCIICVIFDPKSKLTIFSHCDETIDIQHSQERLLSHFEKQNSDLTTLQVTLAGGWRSHPSSYDYANRMKEFWYKLVGKNLNDELLFKRDCITLDGDLFWKYLKAQTENIFVKGNRFTLFQLIDFHIQMLGETGETFLYLLRKRDDSLSKKIADLAMAFCQSSSLLSDDGGKLLAIQIIQDQNEKTKVLVNIQDAFKSVLSIIGFNAKNGEVFIVDEFDKCCKLIQNRVDKLELQPRYHTSIQNGEDSKERYQLTEITDPYSDKGTEIYDAGENRKQGMHWSQFAISHWDQSATQPQKEQSETFITSDQLIQKQKPI